MAPSIYPQNRGEPERGIKYGVPKFIEIYYNEGSGDRGDNKPTGVTDAAGHTTWFSYDSLGRVIRETDQLGKQTNLQYDAAGNLASRTDALGRTMTYHYDALGRLLQKSGSDGSIATFQYDARGRLSYAGNQNIAYSLTYDTLGRLTGVTDSNNRTISYQYDALGNRTRMTMPDGGAVGYTYDAANRLSRIASFLGEFTFGYDNLGNRTKLTYPNGVATSYGYDPASRLTAILAQGRGTSVNSFNYTHDAVGNRLSKTEQQKERATRYNYAYDATYQLTQSLPTVLREDKERGDEKDKRNEHDSDSDSKRDKDMSEGNHEHERNHRAENFVYGTVGNRLRGPGHADASVYNELNQLLASRTEEFRYDANGNLIYKAGLADEDGEDYEQQGWSYEYDLENRLVKASKTGEHGSRIISFKYDPFGRRIEKKVEETAHGETEARITTYVYDNEDIILEISGKATSRYVHGPGIDEPLAMEQKRSTHFFHADGLGSIVNLTDQRGRVVQSYEYSSFGRMKEHGGEVKQPYGFTGREWDKELGLYYYRARYYDPKGGRFISKDPIGFAGGDVNLYRYVQNNPVNLTDPEGLASCVPFEDCFKKCIDDNYGASFYVARDLSPLSAPSLAQDVYNNFTETIAKDTLKSLPLEGAFTKGNITQKIAASNKAASRAKLLSPLTKGLGTLSNVSGIIGAGAGGYVVGASGYCAAKCAAQ